VPNVHNSMEVGCHGGSHGILGGDHTVASMGGGRASARWWWSVTKVLLSVTHGMMDLLDHVSLLVTSGCH
jgi:hypothetical protein